jgi:hypothetical protein
MKENVKNVNTEYLLDNMILFFCFLSKNELAYITCLMRKVENSFFSKQILVPNGQYATSCPFSYWEIYARE